MVLELEFISNWIQINDIYTRYVHAADDCDFDALDKLFLDETTFDWSSETNPLPLVTWASLREAQAFPLQSVLPWAFHICGNVRIDISAGGKTAETKSKTIMPCGSGEQSTQRQKFFQVNGEYVDRLVKVEDGWRIVSRKWLERFAIGVFDKVEDIPGELGIEPSRQ
ncbi:hypothetical protein CB0940_03909 [Cercospora beticola]|uniref:SnoaL-like domain-containing protein n=1 Tax=Cercospora beticola TaxID=122368 RepID=A0A2G5HLQ3_CERBT|nr:hypothetical protein CB0940_03909 [Cercospora beticola]PIA93496.1 hypothetical protein CB0940_03909 [Cercospora beticola]WPB01111.1 hypothetical protein RHO25_005732 [Cercospora beticola]